MNVISLTFLICVYVSIVCFLLGLVQNIFQHINTKYKHLKQQLKDSQE